MSRLFALRDWQVPITVWAVVSVLAGLMGPFGTYEALEPLPRLFYWAAVAGLSVFLWFLSDTYLRGIAPVYDVLIAIGYTLILSAAVLGLNELVFGGWLNLPSALRVLGMVGGVVAVLEVAARLVLPVLRQHRRQAGGLPDCPDARFQQRLEPRHRGKLIRIESQDHYLKVVTDRGEGLVLMRMGDAEVELGQGLGLRVHRSHWVAAEAVRRAIRADGRLLLEMADGTRVPVSRAYRAAVVEAGLAP